MNRLGPNKKYRLYRVTMQICVIIDTHLGYTRMTEILYVCHSKLFIQMEYFVNLQCQINICICLLLLLLPGTEMTLPIVYILDVCR
jgi:hypothetical protein